MKRYPTTLFASAADHTYVECGTGGKGWGCWGGKKGGIAFGQGPGSTRRADMIAQPNERAGIRCYLVNGVCHQAANRILIAAGGITVLGARGYKLSQLLYGTYGRPRSWPCHSPFNQHQTVTGDLPECAAVTAVSPMGEEATTGEIDEAEMDLNRSVRELYRAHDELFTEEATPLALRDVEEFDLEHFRTVVEHRLGEVDAQHRDELMYVRRETEHSQISLERGLADDALSGPEFVEAINAMTERFQIEMGQRTSDAEYQELVGLSKDEVIVLADPAIVSGTFRE
jgi:hypothetical protein